MYDRERLRGIGEVNCRPANDQKLYAEVVTYLTKDNPDRLKAAILLAKFELSPLKLNETVENQIKREAA